MYTYAVVLVAIFLMAFLWFVFYAGMTQISGAMGSTMAQYDTNGSAYDTFELANIFMNNLWTFFLVLVFFGLLLWAYVYSQRKGEVMLVR